MIKELYVYLYWDDEAEQEMILGWETAPGILNPCLSPELENVKVLGALALPKAKRAGKEVRLFKFSSRELLEYIPS